MRYDFLIETYESERIKVVSVWSMFADEDLSVRPHPTDTRGRSVHEHMVHQCVSEDSWFRTMLNIDVGAPPLPTDESRLEFMRKYAEDSGKRLAALREKGETWWEEQTTFFDVSRSRAWVLGDSAVLQARIRYMITFGRKCQSPRGPASAHMKYSHSSAWAAWVRFIERETHG
jgi:hypothetical protein